MNRSLIVFTVVLGASLVSATFGELPVLTAVKSGQPVSIILDTDIGPDYDDVGALAILHALADRGEARPLAIIASNRNALVVPVIQILNSYFGRLNLAVGAPKGPAPDKSSPLHWPEMITAKYAAPVAAKAKIMDAVTLYRKILSIEPQHSVTIASIGFLTNLANLLESKPDRYSALTGRELVRQKVKLLVSMAGWFPGGREYNLETDSLASNKVFNTWPTPVIYSGFEIGKVIFTGPGLVSQRGLDSPVKDIFAYSMPRAKEDSAGRMSWDETAVIVAVKGVSPYFDSQRGHIVIKGGSNTWKNDAAGSQSYLVFRKDQPPLAVATQLEALMAHKGSFKYLRRK